MLTFHLISVHNCRARLTQCQLESVSLEIHWSVESEKRTILYAKDFIDRMRVNCPNVRIEAKLEALSTIRSDALANSNLKFAANT
jgi:hypothetical protein